MRCGHVLQRISVSSCFFCVSGLRPPSGATGPTVPLGEHLDRVVEPLLTCAVAPHLGDEWVRPPPAR